MTQLHIDTARIIGTTTGNELLGDTPELLDMVQAFLATPQFPEHAFDSLPYIGGGRNSIVRQFGDIAVKISTPTTGKNGWEYTANSSTENLFHQHLFLRTLDSHLVDAANLTVPDQLIAIKSKNKPHYVSFQQYMAGWQSLKSWIQQDAQNTLSVEELRHHVQNRIKASVHHPLMRLGLNDIGLHRWSQLNAGNILIEPSAIDYTKSQLCIIDQPGYGISSSVAINGLRLTRQAPRSD